MSSGKNRPLVALRALFALARNPDDLPTVFNVVGSLPGTTPGRMLERIRSTGDGRRLLETRPNLRARLADRASLLALPPGSLGRAYADLTEQAGISAQGILDASIAGRGSATEASDDLRFVEERMRDTHDLWHVVTGYGVDVLGELGLLAFTFAQTRHPGVGLILGLALVKDCSGTRPMIEGAYRRGSRAVWLPDVAWEELLDRSLDDVRTSLRVGAPPAYTPVTTAELRATGRLPAAA